MEQMRPVGEIIQKIAFECQESGATKWEILRVIKALEETKGNERQLMKKAAETLAELNPGAAKTLESFERMRVYTSAGKRQAFDRGNIIKSLLKETKLSRAVAKKIGTEVEDRLKDLRVDYLNTQLIREMVNVRLLDYGHEPIHSQYARLGMPVFEAEKKLSEGGFENREILNEYNWLCVIKGEARDLHFDSVIHVFRAEDFSTKMHSAAMFFPEAKEEMLAKIYSLEKSLGEAVTIRALNFSGTAEKSGRKAGAEIKALDTILTATGKKRAAEAALFQDYEWQKSRVPKKSAIGFAKELLKAPLKNIEPWICLDSKYQAKLLPQKAIETTGIINNSKTQATAFPSGIICGNRTRILQMTGVNLAKVLEASAMGEARFTERLAEISSAITEMCEKKKKILEKRRGFAKELLEGSANAVSLAGLARASEALNPEEPWKEAEKIINLFSKDFCVTHLQDTEALEKFGIGEERAKTQEILLSMNQKARKTFGFVYSAKTNSEMQEMLSDCPAVKLSRARGNS